MRRLKINYKNVDYYYVFIDKYMKHVKKCIELLFSIKFTFFNFTYESVKEKNGMSTGLCINHGISKELQDFINSIEPDHFLENEFDSEIDHRCFKTIAQKKIISENISKKGLDNLKNSILLIKAINFHPV